MAKKNVLIKRLASVETPGGSNTIFTDKTGTLTKNKVEVNDFVFFDETTKFVKGNEDIPGAVKKNGPALEKLLLVSTLCNNAVSKAKESTAKHIGDPVEISFLHFASANKIKNNRCECGLPPLLLNNRLVTKQK